MDIGLLIIRLVVGLNMAAHGGQKLFGWFDGPGLDGTAAMMTKLGLHPARTQAWLAGLAELGAGLFFALGFLTPLAAGGIISVMLVATLTVHRPKGYFNARGGFELPFILSAVSLGVAFEGAGYYSLDRVLHLGLSGFGTGAFAIALGLLAGGLLVAIGGSHRGPVRSG